MVYRALTQQAIVDGADPSLELEAPASGEEEAEIIILLEETPLISINLADGQGAVCVP